jgi:hypothetical protein
MSTLDGFNANEHDDPGFDPIPEGNYLLIVESSEMKPTKAGTGTGINLKFQVVDGEHKGRGFFKWINYKNPNETAQKIGRAELAMLCRACNKPQPKDTMELHNIPFAAHVVVKPAKGEYDASNDIKKAVPKSELAALTGGANEEAKAGAAPWAK